MSKVHVIAEIGINHNGDLGIAKKLIQIAAASGCDSVKFQKRNPDVCVPEHQKSVIRDTPWGKMTYLDYKYKVEFEKTISLVESRNYSQALKLIMSIADEVNTYISIKEPWTLAKDNNIEECLEVCSNALAIFCSLNVLLTPFMPNITNKISAFLKVNNLKYSDIYMQCINEINEYDHIIKRLDAKDFEGMVAK